MSNIKQMYEDKNKTIKAYPKVWLPIGTVYFNRYDIQSEIKQYFEGVWERCLEGEVPVGVKAGDSDFSTTWQAVGSKTVILTETQIPGHTHSLYGNSSSYSSAGSGYWHLSNVIEGYSNGSRVQIYANNAATNVTGGSGAHNNIQPSRTLYAWIRVS